VYVQAQVGLDVPAERLHDLAHHGLPQRVAVVHEERRRVGVQHRLAEPMQRGRADTDSTWVSSATEIAADQLHGEAQGSGE
jgi:hypothetical protein